MFNLHRWQWLNINAMATEHGLRKRTVGGEVTDDLRFRSVTTQVFTKSTRTMIFKVSFSVPYQALFIADCSKWTELTCPATLVSTFGLSPFLCSTHVNRSGLWQNAIRDDVTWRISGQIRGKKPFEKSLLQVLRSFLRPQNPGGTV